MRARPGPDPDPDPNQAQEEAQRRQRDAMRGRRSSARDASSSYLLSPTSERPRPHSAAAAASATGDVPAAAALPHPATGLAAVPSIAASGVSVPDGAALCSPSAGPTTLNAYRLTHLGAYSYYSGPKCLSLARDSPSRVDVNSRSTRRGCPSTTPARPTCAKWRPTRRRWTSMSCLQPSTGQAAFPTSQTRPSLGSPSHRDAGHR